MKIFFFYTHMFPQKTWRSVSEKLQADSILLHLIHQGENIAFEELSAEKDDDIIFIGEISKSLPGYQEIVNVAHIVKHRMFLGVESPDDLNTFTEEQTLTIKEYLKKTCAENFYNGMKCLAALSGKKNSYKDVKAVQTDGIYHPEANSFFSDSDSYIKWYQIHKGQIDSLSKAGIICYHNQLSERNTAEVDTLIALLEANSILPVCVFTENILNTAADPDKRYPWMHYFRDDRIHPDILLNLLAGRFLSTPEDTQILKILNVPVIQLIKSYAHTAEQWLEDPAGLKSHSIVYAISQPEMNGVIDPTMVACVDSPKAVVMSGEYCFVPVQERIEILVKRMLNWIQLQKKPNIEKKITFVLHNNPCKGVESTIGMAVGLDTFKSLARVLRSLKENGYDAGEASLSGDDIKTMIFERKAFAEFRWTTVDEIVRKGGVLYAMGAEEYHTYFETLPGKSRDKVIRDWGPFPGKGMILEQNNESRLIITGLKLGNIQIMVQPKRGCYGAKCNGEVCRILHDPDLSPPHHWLATYKYIQDTSDAVIHFGAEGSLEYLPGKRAALSAECFPDISLGALPNFYVYAMDIPGEGLMAKRRGRAVIIDHLTPVYLPVSLDEDIMRLQDYLDQYQKTGMMQESARMERIKEKMRLLINDLNMGDTPSDTTEFSEFTQMLSRKIRRMRNSLSPIGLHVLGKSPDDFQKSQMLFTLFNNLNNKPSDECALPDLKQILSDSSGDVESACREIHSILCDDPSSPSDKMAGVYKDFQKFCRPIMNKIDDSQHEIESLISSLNGSFLEAGLGGSFYQGKLDTLPTGRNFYPTDISALPTQTAWEIGKLMTDKLLVKYYGEEGSFPENIGMSLWSSDAFKSDGEVFSQILYLLGVKPVWHANGRIKGLEVIPIESLTVSLDNEISLKKRPRVDVTIQTSGILRDMVPNFCDLMDEAVVMVSRLDESVESNFVLKRTRRKIDELTKELGDTFPAKTIERMATFRVFSSAPGTYGLGIGLALDASAWKNETDLAETYINWGGYAYGSSKIKSGIDVYGFEAHKLLAGQLKDIDISYMKQSSLEYDVLDCGGFAVFQGGMALTGKTLGGQSKIPKLYWGDTSQTDDLDIREMKDEIERAARTKLFNQKWLEDMKSHDFQGAQSIASKINNLFKLSATTRSVDKWLFDTVVDMYLNDPATVEWMRAVNPYALEEITRRLLEAQSRELWDADYEKLEQVKSVALIIEGDMEEQIGDVTEEFQGNQVDVMTREDVKTWNPKFKLADLK